MTSKTHYAMETEEQRRLRCEAGRFVAECRVAAGLTQKQLADRVGKAYYTFVSQVEGGSKRIPPDEIGDWAKAMGIDDVRWFARRLFRCYDPVMFSLVFGPGEACCHRETGGGFEQERELHRRPYDHHDPAQASLGSGAQPPGGANGSSGEGEGRIQEGALRGQESGRGKGGPETGDIRPLRRRGSEGAA